MSDIITLCLYNLFNKKVRFYLTFLLTVVIFSSMTHTKNIKVNKKGNLVKDLSPFDLIISKSNKITIRPADNKKLWPNDNTLLPNSEYKKATDKMIWNRYLKSLFGKQPYSKYKFCTPIIFNETLPAILKSLQNKLNDIRIKKGIKS